jgi:DNA repair photolyase
MVAPVIPHLSDDDAAIDALLARIAAAGATSATVLALHLRPGTREWWFTWLERAEPALVPAYRSLYGRGTYATSAYRDDLARRVRPLLERHGLAARHASEHRQVATVTTKPAITVPTLF